MRQTTRTSPKWREQLANEVRGVVRLDELLGPRTSLGIGGTVDAWFEPVDTEDLSIGLRVARRRRVPWCIIGGGSNVLIADSGIRGMAVHLNPSFKQIEVTTCGDLVRVSYGAGIGCSMARRHAMDSELVGLEFLAGIPGTLGGAVRMNAGTRLGDMSDVVESVEIVSAEGARSISAGDLCFAYRSASLPLEAVITRVAVLLRQADPVSLASARERMQKEIEWRRVKQPKGRSAGSIFKNPPGDFAGRLIEECGLKGHRVGGAFVSDRHANFFMNDGTASAADMSELIDSCRREVEARLGVRLDLEIELMGEHHAD